MYKKILLPVLLTFIITSHGLGQIHNPEGGIEPKDTVPPVFHFVLGNWINPMDEAGCILLGKLYNLEVRSVIYLGTNQLQNYPGIYLSTQFNGGPVNLSTEPLIAEQLEAIVLEDGNMVYKYEEVAYTGNFGDQCGLDPYSPIPFDYNISIVDENGNPYPIEQHLSLLDFGTIETPTDNSISPVISYSGTKDLCCIGEPIVDPAGETTRVNPTGLRIEQVSKEDIEREGTGTMGTATTTASTGESYPEVLNRTAMSSGSDGLNLSPNPFDAYLNIGFQASKSSLTMIQILDVNGRLIDQLEYQSVSSGIASTQLKTNHLEAGIYYCRIKNDRYTKTYKVLKMNH